MEEEFKNIISRVCDLYVKYGIRSLSMDDVARELGISKKTLYKYVSEKKNLVDNAMEYYHNKLEKEIDEIYNLYPSTPNVIDILIHLSKVIINKINSLNPSIIYDLQKYYPTLWTEFMMRKRNYVYGRMIENLKLGIKQGFYRDDLNIDIIARTYVIRMEYLIKDYNYISDNNKYKFDEIIKTVFLYHIRAISNEKGLEYIDKNVKINDII